MKKDSKIAGCKKEGKAVSKTKKRLKKLKNNKKQAKKAYKKALAIAIKKLKKTKLKEEYSIYQTSKAKCKKGKKAYKKALCKLEACELKQISNQEIEKVEEVKKEEPAPIVAKPAPEVSKPAATTPKPEPIAKPKIVKTKTMTTTTISYNGRRYKQDDLKIVEGIGPKIESLLKADGITTWKLLSTAPVDKVKDILLKAGSRFRMHNPATWGLQAELAANGKWEDLIQLQDRLKGGRVVS